MKIKDENQKYNKPARIKEGDGKFLTFVKKNYTVLSLVLVIIIILLWAVIKMKNLEKTANNEKQQISEMYESALDSLSVSSMELTAQVFSWAIRGEMLRQNMDQVNQFFNSFIQEPGITKIRLIDPATARIILSTDKKDEGAIIEDTHIVNAERTYHVSGEAEVMIISPVMGLNARIGVLVIVIDKKYRNEQLR